MLQQIRKSKASNWSINHLNLLLLHKTLEAMKSTKNLLLAGLCTLGLVLSTELVTAQPGGGGGPGNQQGCIPPPCVPIDGGISILLAAGALYGGKKVYDHKKG